MIMRFSRAIPLFSVVCLLTVGCYNNPHISERKPGSGPANIHARPAVGPGTLDGGSTAGPQPVVHKAGGHTEPTPSGAVGGHPAEGVANAPQPNMHGGGETPKGPASRTGNEKGGDERGSAHGAEAQPPKH